MFGKSIQSDTAEPSTFYLLIAATNFQQAGHTRHPHAADTLRDIGREYLAKAADPEDAALVLCGGRHGRVRVRGVLTRGATVTFSHRLAGAFRPLPA